MKPYLLLFLLSSLLSTAQIVPRNLLQKNYPLETVQHLLIPLDQWTPYPKTPAAWQKAITDSVRTGLIQRGEVAAAKPLLPLTATLTLEYVRTANRTHYEEITFNRRHDLLDLTMAEAVEGKGRFTDAIVNMVWAICEESYWGIPAHIGTQKAGSGLPDVEERTVDLFAAETAAVLALTDYLVGGQLDKVSPLIRKRIYHETNIRLFEPIQVPNRYGYLRKDVKANNWNSWIMSNWMTATLFLERNEQRRAQMLHAAMSGLDLYLNGLGEDGGTDEGPMYWFAAGGCVFDALETLESASGGKINIYDQPIIRNMASYVYKMHIANAYFVDFADADPMLRPDGLMLYRFGEKIKDDTLKQFGAWGFRTFGITRVINSFQRQRQVWNVLTVKAVQEIPNAPFTNVPEVWFPDVQVMAARSKTLFVATHAGHNAESHNHNDVGDFIVYAKGEPVIIDAGRGTYTANTFSGRRYKLWFTQSQYHNLPIINGYGQKDGLAYTAKNVAYRKNEASLKMDLAAAYPKEAGLRNWWRTVQLNRKKETVEIREEYQLEKAPQNLTQVFLTLSQVTTTTPGIVTFEGPNHPSVKLSYDAKRWKVRTEPVSLGTPDDEAFKTSWGTGKTIQRVLLEQISPVSKGKHRFVFSLAN